MRWGRTRGRAGHQGPSPGLRGGLSAALWWAGGLRLLLCALGTRPRQGTVPISGVASCTTSTQGSWGQACWRPRTGTGQGQRHTSRPPASPLHQEHLRHSSPHASSPRRAARPAELCFIFRILSFYIKFNVNPQINANHTLLLYYYSRKCCLQVPLAILAIPLMPTYQKICLWSPGG